MSVFEGDSVGMLRSHCRPVSVVPSSAFRGFRFPPEVIVLAVRWYMRFGLSYRDVEALLVERGIEVDHVTVFRWVQQYGQIIDVYVSARRDTQAARRFFATALRAHGEPTEVVTDRAPSLLAVVDELLPGAFHSIEQYANNRVEADHGRLKARLRPMRGLKRDCTARVIMRGHAFVQNVRRGHYDLGGAMPDPFAVSRPRLPNSPAPYERGADGTRTYAARSNSTQQSPRKAWRHERAGVMPAS
jgi:transposase-like protein